MHSQQEKFRRFAHGDRNAAIPNFEPGPLLSTYDRWLAEGLTPALDPHRYEEWCGAFGLDRHPLRLSITPKKEALYPEEIVDETATSVTIRRGDGSIIQDNKGTHKSIPHEIRPAVTNRGEWEKLKAWLDVDAPLPPADDPTMAGVLKTMRKADQPVFLHVGSLLGTPRNLLGFEEFAVKPYEDPEWFEDMIETQCRAAERQVRFLGENRVPVDGIHFWEDICYKNGPIISPRHFIEYAVPRYRRLSELAGRFGYRLVSVDSDGDLTALIDGWLEGGINMLLPLEAQAGMDLNALQEKYPGRVLWMGGVHKFRLTGGEKEITAELERIRPAVLKGMCIPMLDHHVPHDVSFEHYLAYLRLKQDILGIGNGAPDRDTIFAKD